MIDTYETLPTFDWYREQMESGWQDHPPLDRGLVGYWPLNGNAMDVSGRGKHGTAVGTGGYASSERGRVANFNGADDTDHIITQFASPFGVTNFSLNTWVWLNSSQPNSAPKWAGMGDTGNGEWMWGISGSSNFTHIFYGDGGNTYVVSTADVPSNEWFMATVVNVNDVTCTLYINGVADGVDSIIGASDYVDTTPLRFGNADGDANRWMTGAISDFSIFNRVISVAEISQLYDIQKRQYYPGPPIFLPVSGGAPAGRTANITQILPQWVA